MAQNAFGEPQYGSNAMGGGGNNAARERARRNRQRRNRNRGGIGGGGGGAGGGATGGTADDPNDGMTEIPFDPNTMSSSGSLTNPVTPDNSYGNTGPNPLDTGVGSNNFNNADLRNQSAWGLLNQAGLTNDGSGDGIFIDNLVNQWADQYDGLQGTENPNLTYENFLYGLIGNNAPNPSVATPGTEQWRQQVYYPTMQQEIQRAVARATPTQRRRDPSRWTGTGTTVAFG